MSESTDKKYVSAFDLFTKSVDLIKENLQLFAIVNSIPLLMTLLSALNGSKGGEFAVDSASGALSVNWAAVLGVSLGVGAVLVVVSAVLQTMALRLELDVAKGTKTTLSKLWEFCQKYFFRLLGLGFIMALFIGAGLILLVVPGIILITRYFFAPYVMIDENLGIFASLKRSSELSKDNWGAIWSVIGVTLLISFVPTFIGKIGEVIAALLGIAYSVAPALRYLEVKKASK